MDRDREFGEFVDARALVMRRTAFLLCGDWHRAEDIVQTALIKLYVAWARVRKDSVDAYARKVLVRTAIDEGRRGFFQRERITDAVPEHPVTDDSADFDLRLALDALPPGQRAVVVLRYWEDLSVTETARILGRTEGTVKSQAAKGLAALRDLLVDEPVSRIYASDVIRKGKTKLTRRRTAVAAALAFVLVAGLGTVGYLALPRPSSTAGMISADAGGNSAADRNAQLTQLLHAANVIPAGMTAEAVPEYSAEPLRFYSDEKIRYAVARLTDAKGTGGFSIFLVSVSPTGTPPLTCTAGQADCRIDEVNGNRVLSYRVLGQDGGQAWIAQLVLPGGRYVEITADNVGRFRANLPPQPVFGAPAARPEPVLDREALIKIATLPGLTF